MNIKKIIKSQRVRHRLMKLTRWMPDRLVIPIQYKLILGFWPNLKQPKRFTEWIQVYKMRYRNPDLPNCVDKYLVRNFIDEKKGRGDILNELYQVCKRGEEIDFDKLPSRFVIKTTNGGGGDNVEVVRNKNEIDRGIIIRKVNSWLKKDYSHTSREWAYIEASNNPKIIIEKYLENEDGLDDYKFFCFNGKFKYLWVDKGRYTNHRRGFWDENLKFIKEITREYPTFDKEPSLPSNIKDMIKLAEHLSEGFPFVRVDLYNVKGKIIFGELTFYPGSGYSKFNPDEFDYKLGEFFPKI